MSLKDRLRAWLGIDELSDRDSAIIRDLTHAEAVIEDFESRLAAQKREHERQVSLVLGASVKAAEKIAKVVADRGDAELKQYIDACMESVQEVLSQERP